MSRPLAATVIVGASAAGLAAADGLREGGYDGTITVLDEELQPSYDRPMLSKGLLAARVKREPASLRTPEQLAASRVEVAPGHAAVGLDIDRRLLVTSDGEAIPWAQVIIATAVRARPLLTTAGSVLPTLRTRLDLETARLIAVAGGPVGLIGGGFIGLEVAAALRSREVDVAVFEAAAMPLRGPLGPAVSEWTAGLHIRNGVRLHLGSGVTAVQELRPGYRITLADGTQHDVAQVIAGLGTEARTEWLLGSGVETEHGVVTDAAGRTNVPGVWAAGDVAHALDPATGRHRRIEHWTYAIEQGRHVGLNAARGKRAVPGRPVLLDRAVRPHRTRRRQAHARG